MDFLTSKKFTTILSFLGLFLLAAGGSWALFTYLKGSPSSTSTSTSQNTSSGRAKISADLPKTEPCPINGKLYSVPEKDIWQSRRPITAMIENHVDARPQSGLSSADVVYEAVAEGGITRFMAVFYCGVAAADTKLAPIRSARVYFISWAAEYGTDPIFLHVGGANDVCSTCYGGVKPSSEINPKVNAFKLLDSLGWRASSGNDFDGGTNIGYPVIIRDQYRLGNGTQSAWEHSVVASSDKVYDEAQKRGFSFKDSSGSAWNNNYLSWNFADDKALDSAKASDISFDFWSSSNDYSVEWKYDKSTNQYLRFNGGKEHTDLNTGKQIAAKNVVVQFVDEQGPVDTEKHMYYTTIGTGKALIFQNGDVIQATWKKNSLQERTIFTDSNGKQISFVRGLIWVEGVPTGNKVNY